MMEKRHRQAGAKQVPEARFSHDAMPAPRRFVPAVASIVSVVYQS